MLQFENLSLRKAKVEDALQLVSWWNDGEVMAHAGFPNGVGVQVDEVVTLIKKDTDSERCHFIMEVNTKPIGEMHYKKQSDNSAELGIKICDFAFHNKGFGKKFLSLLISDLFDKNLYTILQVNVAKKNKIAQHVYEKLGFKEISSSKCVSKKYKDRKNGSIKYELNKQDFVDYLRCD